jgi:hypothetical protein
MVHGLHPHGCPNFRGGVRSAGRPSDSERGRPRGSLRHGAGLDLAPTSRAPLPSRSLASRFRGQRPRDLGRVSSHGGFRKPDPAHHPGPSSSVRNRDQEPRKVDVGTVGRRELGELRPSVGTGISADAPGPETDESQAWVSDPKNATFLRNPRSGDREWFPVPDPRWRSSREYYRARCPLGNHAVGLGQEARSGARRHGGISLPEPPRGKSATDGHRSPLRLGSCRGSSVPGRYRPDHRWPGVCCFRRGRGRSAPGPRDSEAPDRRTPTRRPCDRPGRSRLRPPQTHHGDSLRDFGRADSPRSNGGAAKSAFPTEALAGEEGRSLGLAVRAGPRPGPPQ